MANLKIVLVILMLFLSCQVKSQEDIFKQALLKELLNSAVLNFSVGKLNGVSHTAAIVSGKDESDMEALIALIILQSDKAGNNKIVAKSPFWLPHQRHSWNVEIKANSVFLSVDGSGGCCSHYFYDFQFKPYNGAFKLVGTEIQETGFQYQENNKMTAYNAGSSINFLTGIVIHYMTRGHTTEDSPWDIIGKKTRIERKFNFSNSKAWTVANFDYWLFTDFVSESKNLGDYTWEK